MPYSDYFWGGEPTDQYKYFMDFDENHEKHIYYLHGALFIFKISPHTCKLIRSGENQELVTLIENAISKGRMPLFVSEGLSKEKLKFIEKSGYLGFCYKNLKESKHKLVVYGTSFSKYDAHITNAIKQGKPRRELAISVYINDKTKYNLKEEMNQLIKKFKYHKISFFDSRTIFKF